MDRIGLQKQIVEHERTPGELDVLKHLPMLVFKMEQFDIAMCTLAKLVSPRAMDTSHGEQQQVSYACSGAHAMPRGAFTPSFCARPVSRRACAQLTQRS